LAHIYNHKLLHGTKMKKKKKLHFDIDINTHPNWRKDEVAKEEFHSSLEKVSDAVPNYNMKTVLGDFKVKGGKES